MKPGGRRSWAVLLIALLALVSTGSFVHTDDGCQVEIHCLACRLHIGTRGGTAVPALEIAAPVAACDHPAPSREPAPLAPAAWPQPSRGPPLT